MNKRVVRGGIVSVMVIIWVIAVEIIPQSFLFANKGETTMNLSVKDNSVVQQDIMLKPDQILGQVKAHQALEFAQKVLDIPEGYELKNAQRVLQNQEYAWLFRYEKSNGENNGLHGEHYSFIVAENSMQLLGVTWMDGKFNEHELPSKEKTTTIASVFLDRIEPGLKEKLRVNFINKHDESIQVKDDKGKVFPIVVSGMKFKCYKPDTNDYAWVIVGSGDKVITYERGIIWDNGRVTEKWLHDSWLAER